MNETLAGVDLARDVEAFLIREARLIDEHRYDEWMELWEEELVYWVPCNEDDFDPGKHVSLIYDGRESLTERVWRLKGKQAHAQRPKSKLLRTVSNVVVEEVAGDEISVSSAFVLGEVRNAVQTIYLGRNLHALVRRGGGLRMRRKKVMLLNNDAPLGNLTFLL
jgi:3-phenylpropionate/cinnamic acid dioxygenase small subunit